MTARVLALGSGLARRSGLALVCALAPFAAGAQSVPVSSGAPAADGHLLEIRDGAVHLDGSLLRGAVPDGLDLSGMTLALDYSGPVTPVVEVDGQAWVLEGGRLLRFEESTRAGERVYILGEARPDPASVGEMADDRVALVSQEAYLREVASRDQALYEKMQHEHVLEGDVHGLAERVRAMAPGPERVRLRGDLRARLSELFALKQQIRREEVDRAQAELDAVRTLLDARDAQHDAIVDGRLRRLCGD
jgi:hypothetical protein